MSLMSTRLNLHRVVLIPVPDQKPKISAIKLDGAHANILSPVRLLMTHQLVLAHPLAKDVDSKWRQRDATIAKGPQEPPDDVPSFPYHVNTAARTQVLVATQM